MLENKKQTTYKTVVSMLPCGALEKSNNPYIESFLEPCVSKIRRERDPCYLGLIGKKILKKV